MSEDVGERRPAPDQPTEGPPPPSAYGAHSSSLQSSPQPPSPAGAAPGGPHYGPVPRYAQPRDVPQPAPSSFPPPPTAPAPTGGPGPGAWPPPTGPGPAPAARPALPPGPFAGQLAAPQVWPGATGWGPGGPWSPPPRGDYASWLRRVAGFAIDAAPSWVASGVLYAGYLPVYVGLFRRDFGVAPHYRLVLVGTLLSVLAFAWQVWNRYFLAGRTGQSVGKRVTKMWLVGRATGRPVGPLNAFVRELLHILDGFGYVGYLWPLWDDERQTLADKVAQTVVVRTPVPPLTDLERRHP